MSIFGKDASAALAAIRLWHLLDPSSQEAAKYYINFMVIQGNLDQVKPLLEKRLQQVSPNTRGELLLQIQYLLTQSPDHHQALRLLELLTTPYLSLPETHVALAQVAFTTGNTARAMAEANLARQIAPTSETAILTFAQINPDTDDAINSIIEFLSKNPHAKLVRHVYAQALIDKKDYLNALKQFDLLYQQDPKDMTALIAIGLLETQLANFNAAKRHLTQYLDQILVDKDTRPLADPTQALFILAQIAIEEHDADAALNWLAQIHSPEAYLDAQLKRAELFAIKGQLQQARQTLHTIQTKSSAEKIRIIRTEVKILRDAYHFTEAFHLLETAIHDHPHDENLLYEYAMIAQQINNLSIAEKSLRTLIRRSPKNARALNALGYLFVEHNIHLDQASALLQKANALKPNDPFILDSLGWMEFRYGNFDSAEVYVRAAHRLLPNIEIALHLIEILWHKGQKDNAKDLFNKMYQKDPKNKALQKMLKQLPIKKLAPIQSSNQVILKRENSTGPS